MHFGPQLGTHARRDPHLDAGTEPGGLAGGSVTSELGAILVSMATYEYLCLSCERPFEQRRSMTGQVETALACPACGSERVRRRFSFMTAKPLGSEGHAGASCGCGGACACRG